MLKSCALAQLSCPRRYAYARAPIGVKIPPKIASQLRYSAGDFHPHLRQALPRGLVSIFGVNFCVDSVRTERTPHYVRPGCMVWFGLSHVDHAASLHVGYRVRAKVVAL